MFQIITDSSANLPSEYLRANAVASIPFAYSIDGVEHLCESDREFDGRAYYDAIRAGSSVVTSQICPQRYIDTTAPYLAAGEDVLFVGMSSGISGSYSSAEVAAAQLREEYPERRLRLIDTYAASLGEGLAVMEAVRLRDAGESVDAAADALLVFREHICQVFTVDDLMYLKKNGRLCTVGAIAGTVLQIKPVLKGDELGRIVVSGKVRGRRRAVAALAEKYAALVKNAAEQTVCIAHTDCPEDARELERMINSSLAPKDIMTVCYEPVTGSHVGPGTLALFFLGAGNVRTLC